MLFWHPVLEWRIGQSQQWKDGGICPLEQRSWSSCKRTLKLLPTTTTRWMNNTMFFINVRFFLFPVIFVAYKELELKYTNNMMDHSTENANLLNSSIQNSIGQFVNYDERSSREIELSVFSSSLSWRNRMKSTNWKLRIAACELNWNRMRVLSDRYSDWVRFDSLGVCVRFSTLRREYQAVPDENYRFEGGRMQWLSGGWVS